MELRPWTEEVLKRKKTQEGICDFIPNGFRAGEERSPRGRLRVSGAWLEEALQQVW